MIPRAPGWRWRSISKIFSTTSLSLKTSIRSFSTSEQITQTKRAGATEAMLTEAETSRSSARSSTNIAGLKSPPEIRRRKNKQHTWEDSDEASRFHKAECRYWSGGLDDGPSGADARPRAGESGLQGVRRSAPRLPDRCGDGKSGKEARGRHQRAPLGPDVSVHAARRREGNHRTDADRRRPDAARQRGIHGSHRRRHQCRQHA